MISLSVCKQCSNSSHFLPVLEGERCQRDDMWNAELDVINFLASTDDFLFQLILCSHLRGVSRGVPLSINGQALMTGTSWLRQNLTDSLNDSRLCKGSPNIRDTSYSMPRVFSLLMTASTALIYAIWPHYCLALLWNYSLKTKFKHHLGSLRLQSEYSFQKGILYHFKATLKG